MLPLSCWQLHARELPDELSIFPKAVSFSLPGAEALEGFADLLGGSGNIPEESAPEDESAPFLLPAMLPDCLEGPASLHRSIDFGSLRGDRCVLTIDHIIGRGRILLGDDVLCRFDSALFTAETIQATRAMTAQPCMLAIDLSDALQLGRKETLIIEFDECRPAGIPGPVLLHTTCGAYLSQLALIPDARQQSFSLHAMITSTEKGRYVLRAQGFPAEGTSAAAREMPVTLEKDETRAICFSFNLAAAPLIPGVSGDMPAVKIQLFARMEHAHGDGMLCDCATLLCGYAPQTPDAWLPLDRAAAFANPQKTTDSMKALHIPTISLDVPAPDGLYRALSRAGIAVRQSMPADHPLRDAIARFPCVCLSDAVPPDTPTSLEASAWQLCSMVSTPRMLDETLSARELLREASGLALDPEDAGVRSTLLWLRALSIRLRAEAARQRRYQGALCAAKEPDQSDVSAALQTAFSPLHLSAVPLCGAWWSGTRFSAILEAFIPRGAYEDNLCAQALLEDENGAEITRFDALCRPSGGHIGVIEAALPDHPCVLELTTRLLHGGEVAEESTLPIYVGERGPLEAAFR